MGDAEDETPLELVRPHNVVDGRGQEEVRRHQRFGATDIRLCFLSPASCQSMLGFHIFCHLQCESQSLHTASTACCCFLWKVDDRNVPVLALEHLLPCIAFHCHFVRHPIIVKISMHWFLSSSRIRFVVTAALLARAAQDHINLSFLLHEYS